MPKKKIAILFYEGYLSIAPTLINFIQFLTDQEFEIDLYTTDTHQQYAPDISIPQLNTVKYKGLLGAVGKKALTSRTKHSFKDILPNLYYYLNATAFANFCKQKVPKKKYDFVIGVDTVGIIAAQSAVNNKDIPLIYFSLEIDFLFVHKFFLSRILKNREIKAHKQCKLTLIQDLDRLNYLLKENQLSLNNTQYLFLPNSPRGGDHLNNHSQGSFFNKLFSLNNDEFIVLAAGMIHEAVFSLKIAEQCATQKNEYKMVFHERQKMNVSTNLYLQKIQQKGGPNLYLSLNPLAYNQIHEIFSSCHIGLALYNPDYGVNFSNIVFASGKLSHFLKFAKPIIVYDLPGMRELIEQWKCGVVINNISQLNQAIQLIKSDYQNYASNAYRCFQQVFNFDKHCIKIKEKMETIS